MVKNAGADYDIGQMYGKPDIERVGLFVDLPRLDGRANKIPYKKQLANCLVQGRKIKCGTNDGYFTPFGRIFEREAIARPKYGKDKRVYVGGMPWTTTGPTKWHSTPGDIHGTFTKEMPAFSAQKKPVPKEARKYYANFVTNPGKKGNAGYAGICLNKYPEHSNDRYGAKLKPKEYGKAGTSPWVPTHYPQPSFTQNVYYEEKGGKTYIVPKGQYREFRPPGYWVPTGPGKKDGGPQGGCINKFPEGRPDRYVSAWEATEKGKGKSPVNKEGKQWAPHSRALKSMYTASVLHHNTDFRVNHKNYKSYKPSYTKYLI